MSPTTHHCALSSSSISPMLIDTDSTSKVSSLGDGDRIVQLNVGGTLHTTMLSTLLRVPGSFFEAMFSGRNGAPRCTTTNAPIYGAAHEVVAPAGCAEIPRVSPASYFIDRDGKHFRHILNYLRCGSVVSLPRDVVSKEELAMEADFYGLDEMLRAIQRPPLILDEHLPKCVLKIQEDERKLRFKFAGGNSETNRLTPYMDLMSLFTNDRNTDGFEGTPVECPLLFDANHPLRQEKSFLYLSTIRGDKAKQREEHGQAVTTRTLDQFLSNFNKQHPNILDRIQDILLKENVIMAGGSVLRALTRGSSLRTGSSHWDKSSDIDLFFYGMSSKQEANALVRRLFLALAVDNESWVIVRCPGVINIHNENTKIQIILRLYDTPTEVLIGFDVDCCACCFTGSDVKITKRCHSALVSGINVLNPLHAWPRKASYELRLGKYAIRGFPVYVPGLPKKWVGYSDEIQKTELKLLDGIARFIKVDIEINSSKKRGYTDSSGKPLVRASTPAEIMSLREPLLDNLTPCEVLISGLEILNIYDGTPFDTGRLRGVLVPDVYGDCVDDFGPWQWVIHYFEMSHETRNQAIETILDCSSQENVPNCVPRKLEDAWRQEKQSREYSNDSMEKIDVDTLYYSPVYDFFEGDTCNDITKE